MEDAGKYIGIAAGVVGVVFLAALTTYVLVAVYRYIVYDKDDLNGPLR